MIEPKAIRVLVAEDDFLVGKEIARTLGTIGYELVGDASDGLEAVDMTCEKRPDVVLMDIKMPRLDGLEAAQRIQECCPTPVVVLTAHETQPLVDRAAKFGVAAYLTKPPTAGEIERAVTVALARFQDLVEMRRLNDDLESKNVELQKALNEIKTLRGIIPLCFNCKKIRDDAGYWENVDLYLSHHTEAKISHGICPDCFEKVYPDYVD